MTNFSNPRKVNMHDSSFIKYTKGYGSDFFVNIAIVTRDSGTSPQNTKTLKVA